MVELAVEELDGEHQPQIQLVRLQWHSGPRVLVHRPKFYQAELGSAGKKANCEAGGRDRQHLLGAEGHRLPNQQGKRTKLRLYLQAHLSRQAKQGRWR